eukprot:6170720-Pyramimonas_sp.AAC.1
MATRHSVADRCSGDTSTKPADCASESASRSLITLMRGAWPDAKGPRKRARSESRPCSPATSAPHSPSAMPKPEGQAS